MRRSSFVGLRARLVLSLVASTALTLAVTALALLSPLENHLRRDELEALREAGAVVRPIMSYVPDTELRPASRRMEQAVRESADRTDAHVVVVSRTGQVLAASVANPGLRARLAAMAVADGRSRLVTDGTGPSAQGIYATVAEADGVPIGVSLSKRLDEVSATVAVVRHAMIVAALIGLGAALLLGLIVASRLARRLEALRHMALRVARLGPVVQMVPDRGIDEVGDLSRAFATMQDRLREQEDARRTFVATASHELRTPLASLRLMLDLAREELAREIPDVGEAEHEVVRAANQAERLSGLAERLLDLSVLDAAPPAELRPVDLRAAAESVAREFSARADEHGQELRVSCTNGSWAMGEPDMLTQVLRILLDNALRFGPEGTAIEIEISGDADTRRVRVRDRGPGVPPDERELIFERFRRGSRTGGEGGFGLGLAIGRELARRMDGGLVLADDSPGACFELRLPAAAPVDGARRPAEDGRVPAQTGTVPSG